jgi:hypothetical protein
MNAGSGSDSEKYGYLDARPCYEARGAKLEIHVRVSVPRDNSFVRVCGYNAKESLKHALFYLDVNATNISPTYEPPVDEAKRLLLTSRKYHGDECTQLSGVPRGTHVLTVSTDPKHPDHVSSFTHVITFE